MAQRERVIYHADMNAYYASVEELLHPELRAAPMAICGSADKHHGIILAKNERAKKYGVKTAETIYKAQQKCPNLVLRPPRHRLYHEYYKRANAIYADYTDLLEPASIDESYLDVTGSLHLFGGDGVALAHTIRERIHAELGLTISVGVSFNKVFAKMGSDMQKPNAVTVITREDFTRTLWPLPVGDMLMVGQATRDILRAMGVHTVGDLARADVRILTARLGKLGEYLHRNANGLDETPVASAQDIRRPQSISNGMTFQRDLSARAEVCTAIRALSDNVAGRLRREGLKCATVQVTVKDAAFRVITRQKGLAAPSWLAYELAEGAMELMDACWKPPKPIRLLAVTAQRLVPDEEATEQLSLFEESNAAREKRERLELAVDKIRARYGGGSITTASIVGNDLGIEWNYRPQEEI